MAVPQGPERRVPQAPTIAFDTPNAGNAGIGTNDDGFLFNGSPERYDWKLLGKQEMYAPYNNNALNNDGTVADLGPKFINPEINRWELHRVWVVEVRIVPKHFVAQAQFAATKHQP